MEEETRTTVRMPKEVHKKLKILAAIHETTINDLIVALIEKEVERVNLDRLRLPKST
jgi:predicted HicB family RNase H-like nuclease